MDGGIAPGSEATGGEDSVQVDREVASDGESLEGDSNKVKEVDSMEEWELYDFGQYRRGSCKDRYSKTLSACGMERKV